MFGWSSSSRASSELSPRGYEPAPLALQGRTPRLAQVDEAQESCLPDSTLPRMPEKGGEVSKPYATILAEFDRSYAMDEFQMSNDQQAQQLDRQQEEERLTRTLSELARFAGRDDCDVSMNDMRLLCAACGINAKEVL